MHHAVSVIYSARTYHGNLQQMMRFAQAISVRGKVVSSAQYNLPVLPCPVKEITSDRHLRGIIRDGLFHKVHTQDGASGPLAVVKRTMIVTIAAMRETKVHRECRLRPRGSHPRPGPLQKSRLWTNQGMAAAINAAGSGTPTTSLDFAGDECYRKRCQNAATGRTPSLAD